MRPSKLVVPAVLVVSSLRLSLACEDDDGTDTGAETSGAETSATSSPSSSTGAVPQECADIVDMTACAEETRFECVWNPDNAECEIDCAAYTDEQSCSAQILCAWDDDAGCIGPI